MLPDVAEAIRQCTEADRAKLARFLTVQAEENLALRPGASRILTWLGVVAAGREPNELSLDDIPVEDRQYVVALAAQLEGIVREESALESARTVEDLEGPAEPAEGTPDPLAEVWRRLARTVKESLPAE